MPRSITDPGHCNRAPGKRVHRRRIERLGTSLGSMTVALPRLPSKTSIESPGSSKAPIGLSNSPGPRPARPTAATNCPFSSNTSGVPDGGITQYRRIRSRTTASGRLSRTPCPAVSPITDTGLISTLHCEQVRASAIKGPLWALARKAPAAPRSRNTNAERITNRCIGCYPADVISDGRLTP
jgi:hypothetical protein